MSEEHSTDFPTQTSFSMIVNSTEPKKIPFEGFEDNLCYVMTVEFDPEYKGTKDAIITIEFDECIEESSDEKVIHKSIEIAKINETEPKKDIEFSCVLINNPQIMIKGDGDVMLSGVFCQPGSSDDEEDEEEEKKE